MVPEQESASAGTNQPETWIFGRISAADLQSTNIDKDAIISTSALIAGSVIQVGRTELAQIPLPQAARTRWPVPHHKIVEALELKTSAIATSTYSAKTMPSQPTALECLRGGGADSKANVQRCFPIRSAKARPAGATPGHCLARGPLSDRTQNRTKYRQKYRYFRLLALSNVFIVNNRWAELTLAPSQFPGSSSRPLASSAGLAS